MVDVPQRDVCVLGEALDACHMPRRDTVPAVCFPL